MLGGVGVRHGHGACTHTLDFVSPFMVFPNLSSLAQRAPHYFRICIPVNNFTVVSWISTLAPPCRFPDRVRASYLPTPSPPHPLFLTHTALLTTTPLLHHHLRILPLPLQQAVGQALCNAGSWNHNRQLKSKGELSRLRFCRLFTLWNSFVL